MQNINFWNSEESITRYAKMPTQLTDAEVTLIGKAVFHLNKKAQEISILDLGCGGGRTTVALDRMNFKVTGIDIAESLVKECKKNYPNIDVRVGDACSLNFQDNTFDIVLFSHNSLDCLEPEEVRFKALQEISRVLKPEGVFIFSSHIFNLIPYDKQTFENVFNNFFTYINSPNKGYYTEQMDNGENVKLYYATDKTIKNQLFDANLILVDQTRIMHVEKSLFLTFIKSLLNWEQYYLAIKQKNIKTKEVESTTSYKDLFEGRFKVTHNFEMNFLEKIYYNLSASTYNEKLLFSHIEKHIDKTSSPKILDAGCGGGHAYLTKYGAVYGTDISKESLKKANQIYQETKEVDLSGKIPYPDNFFDYIFCSEVFGHIYVKDKEIMLKELNRVLKPKGKLFFSVETIGDNLLTRWLIKNNLLQKYWIDYHGHIGLETPTKTKERFIQHFNSIYIAPTSNHILPIDGYLTFEDHIPAIKMLRNTLLRRSLNILMFPLFYTLLKISSFDSANDIVLILQSKK